jgi:pimeloyl-ACP methyl ester carboxylesterase
MGVLRVEGTRLYFQQAGAGEPLVLLHGLGASGADWEYLVPELSRHFQLVVPDLRGHGASDRAGDYGVERFAADTWRLLDHLRVRAPTLVGHSMGGAVANAGHIGLRRLGGGRVFRPGATGGAEAPPSTDVVL